MPGANAGATQETNTTDLTYLQLKNLTIKVQMMSQYHKAYINAGRASKSFIALLPSPFLMK